MDERLGERRCTTCGTPMWRVDIPRAGIIWNCTACTASVLADGRRFKWHLPQAVAVPDRAGGNERKYRSKEPCPECGNPMWAVEIPDYGERKQCEDCRITVVFGGTILRWRTS
jgi:ssDNA-binding Zn-finger/Zn-ribbon topoisomerase 1